MRKSENYFYKHSFRTIFRLNHNFIIVAKFSKQEDMFTRLSRVLTHASLRTFSWKDSPCLVRMSFATQKDLDRLRETAILAQKVIRMIENPHQVSELEKEAWGYDLQLEKVKTYALAERIKNTLAKLNTHPQSRDDVIQLFTEGVVLPKNIFHQDRIQLTTKVDNRFVYNPNSIITSQIFSIFSSNPPIKFKNLSRCMLKGYKGVSKTVSVSLLWYLTRFIDEYRFHQTNVDEQIKKSFKQPIIAYWSFQHFDTFDTVVELLWEQLPDLQKAYTLEELISKKINIGKFYKQKYGVQAHLSIDQINALAQMYRQILVILQNLKKRIESCQEQLKQVQKKKDLAQTNSNSKKMSKTQINSLNKKQKSLQQSISNLKYQEMKKNLKQIEVLQKMQLVTTISEMFNKTIYLSSMDIEQAFLKKCDLSSNRGHTIVQVREVEYARDMYKAESLTDLCHFYVFSMNERVLKPKNLLASDSQLREAQQECIKILKERLADENYFYMTFYSIYKMVSDQDIQRDLNRQNAKVKDFKQKLVQIFKSIVQATTNETIKQFHQHFFKPDKKMNDLRKLVILKMFLKTQSIIEQQKKTNQRSPNQDLSYQISLKDLGLNQESAIDVLPLTFFSQPSICLQLTQLRLPAKLISQMIQPKIQQSLAFYLQNAKEWMENFTTTNGLAGNIQRLFVFAIKNSVKSFEMKYKIKFSDFIQNGSDKYSQIRKGSYPFQPLETGDQKQSLLEKLSTPLQRMLDDGKQCAVLEPVTRKFFRENLDDVKLYHLHETSKGIDVILARAPIINIQRKLYLDLIDVTVQNSLSIIEYKMKDFLQIFLSLKDNHQTFIELEVGPKEMRQKKKFPVELRYFIYCQQNQHPTLLNKLKAQFSSQLTFGESQGANYFQVGLRNSEKSLLSAVGFINIESDVIFQSKKEGEKDVLSFRKACQVLNKRREKKE